MIQMIWLLLLFRVAAVLPQTVPHFDLEDVCGTLGFKQSLYFNKRPVIFTYKSREKLSCHLELHLRKREMGFYVFIERLQIETTPECNTDFLQFGRDNFIFTSYVSEKYCEDIEHVDEVLNEEKRLAKYNFKNTSLEEREYVENVDDEMDIWLKIGPAHGRERKEVVLLVVPYEKNCANSDDSYRGCHSNSINCFEKELFCDKILKCDILDQSEQRSCRHDKNASILPVALIILLSVLSTILAIFIVCCGIVCFGLIRRKHSHRVGRREAHEDIEGTQHEQESEIYDVDQTVSRSEFLAVAPEYTSSPPTYEEVMNSRDKESPPPNYSKIG